MQASHLKALREKHDHVDEKIRLEMARPAWREEVVERMKKERLRLREQIERLEKEKK